MMCVGITKIRHFPGFGISSGNLVSFGAGINTVRIVEWPSVMVERLHVDVKQE